MEYKYEKLRTSIYELIYWAKEQNHISDDAEEILFENLNEIIKEI